MSLETQDTIRLVCNELAEFLIKKNESYGDSAIHPRRFRSSANALEQILVRQDDKLNRILNGQTFSGDNDLKDLVGYWVLEQVVKKLQNGDLVSAPNELIHSRSFESFSHDAWKDRNQEKINGPILNDEIPNLTNLTKRRN